MRDFFVFKTENIDFKLFLYFLVISRRCLYEICDTRFGELYFYRSFVDLYNFQTK